MATNKKPARPRAKQAIRTVPSMTDPTTNPTTQPAINPTTQPAIDPTTQPAIDPDKKWDSAKWDDKDSQTLIDVLLAERRPGNGKPIGPENATSAHGFKIPVWNAAVEKLKGSEEKIINGKTSLPKTADNCKSRWYTLRYRYNDYKHLSQLSGAGWSDGYIDLPDEVWDPILNGKDKDSKKSKDYARCKGRPFPLFDDLASLVEGHQATAKYVKTAIVTKKEPFQDRPPTPSTSATKSSSAHPPTPSTSATKLSSTHPPTPSTSATKSSSTHHHTLSPSSSESDLPDTRQPLQPISGHNSSSSDHKSAANRHGKSKLALKQHTPAPARKKKRTGVDIVDGLSSDLHDMTSFFKSSISSTESAVESTAQAITAAKPSVHAQAVSMIYKSELTRPQCFSAIKLFTNQPVMAETYLSTPAEVRDEWVLSVITD